MRFVLDRFFRNRWLAFAATVDFFVGAGAFFLALVSGMSWLTLVGVLLMAVGLTLIVVPAIRYRMPGYLLGFRLGSEVGISNGLIRDGQAIRAAAEKGHFETPAHAGAALIRWQNRAMFFFSREAPIYNDALAKAGPQHATVVTNEAVAHWTQAQIDVVARAQGERHWR